MAEMDFVDRLIHGLRQYLPAQTPQATAVYDTRITHTPGATTPALSPGVGGYYDPKMSGQELLRNTTLDPATISALQRLGWGQQPGVMQTLQDMSPQIIRHESLHALADRIGGYPDKQSMISAVPKEILSWISSNPIYKREMSAYGREATLADEGAATALNYPNDPVFNGELISQFQKANRPIELKQLLQLLANRGN